MSSARDRYDVGALGVVDEGDVTVGVSHVTVLAGDLHVVGKEPARVAKRCVSPLSVKGVVDPVKRVIIL